MVIVLLLELITISNIGPSLDERLNPGPSNWVHQGQIDLLLFWRPRFFCMFFFKVVMVLTVLCSHLGETNLTCDVYVKINITLKITSLNVNGLRNPIKRSKVAKLKKDKLRIVMLQEMHMLNEEHNKLKWFGYLTSFYSSCKNSKKGECL